LKQGSYRFSFLEATEKQICHHFTPAFSAQKMKIVKIDDKGPRNFNFHDAQNGSRFGGKRFRVNAEVVYLLKREKIWIQFPLVVVFVQPRVLKSSQGKRSREAAFFYRCDSAD
jgi:hypothetical protein